MRNQCVEGVLVLFTHSHPGETRIGKPFHLTSDLSERLSLRIVLAGDRDPLLVANHPINTVRCERQVMVTQSRLLLAGGRIQERRP